MGIVSHCWLTRYYIVFLSEELGGEAGMREVTDVLMEILRYRQIISPSEPSELLSEVEIPDNTLPARKFQALGRSNFRVALRVSRVCLTFPVNFPRHFGLELF